MEYRLRNENQPKNVQNCLEEILTDRGVEDLGSFLHPSKDCELCPYLLDNIEEGAKMLLRHLRANSRILFLVDCDCDGYTSSAILWNYIKAIYPQADLNFTVHEHKQHGLSDKIDWLVDEEQFDLIICPDSSSFDADCHKRLEEINTEVLIADHHLPIYNEDGQPMLSDSSNVVVINNQLSEKYSNKTLCGAGVVYKFCEVLDDILGIKQADNYLDLVALGLIADVMKRTTSETNYLIMEGLKHIKNRGFTALIEAQSFSLKEKANYPYIGLTPIDIAFYIGPLINAITRVGTIKEKETMFYAFIEPDRPMQSTKRGAKAGDIETAAEQTARVGTNAKNKQNKIKEKALDLIDFKIQKEDLLQNNIIIVEIDEDDEIPQEMTGLIAMAVVSKYHKPCMIGRRNSRDELQGSIRSDSNFSGLPSFKTFLEDSGLMTYVAGHDASAGWGLQGSKLESLTQYANTKLSKDDFKNCYLVDYIFNTNEECLPSIAKKIAENDKYFGNGVDEVKAVVTDISLSNIFIMGEEKNSIKISSGGIEFIRFKDTDFVQKIQENRLKKLKVYGGFKLNVYAGRTTIQMIIRDYEFEDDEDRYDF